MRKLNRKKRTDKRQSESPFFANSHERTQQGSGETADFFQAKLKVGEPGDRFEKEADRVADAVVSRSQSGQAADIRRQAETDEEAVQSQTEEEDTVQAQEEEEDAVQAQEQEEDTVQAQEEEDEAVQTKMDDEEQTVQAKQEDDEGVVQRQSEFVQAKPQQSSEGRPGAAKSQPHPAGPAFVSLLQQRKGKGRPLPPDTLAEMESAFQADLSAVRIHTDESAIQLSRMIGAQAFTNGNDIFFNEGKFDPNSEAGKRLLAHELTHTQQQAK